MKVVKPETVGLDAAVLQNIREYLDDTYVKQGKYIGTMTLVSRKGEVAYLDSLGMMDRENKTVATSKSSSVETPRELYRLLNEYVIGQNDAKKILIWLINLLGNIIYVRFSY